MHFPNYCKQYIERFKREHPNCVCADVANGAYELFKRARFLEDSKHYRKCYFDMIYLVPHYRDAIKSAASYNMLLFDNLEELDVYLINTMLTNPHFLEYCERVYGVKMFDEVRNVFCEVCSFKKV